MQMSGTTKLALVAIESGLVPSRLRDAKTILGNFFVTQIN